METKELNAKTTKELLKELVDSGKKYDVSTEVVFIDVLMGFRVKTILTIYDGKQTTFYEGNSFRKHNSLSKYTALETADTVSLGRALRKAGFGIDDDNFASHDEIVSTEGTELKSETEKILTPVARKAPKADANKKEVMVGDKVIHVSKVKDLTHGQAIEAKLAAVNGDFEKANNIVNEVKKEMQKEVETNMVSTEEPPIVVVEETEVRPILGYEYPVIPELKEGRRDITTPDGKQLITDISNLGATKASMIEFGKSVNLKSPNAELQGIDLLVYGTVDQIKQYINTLI